MDFEKLPLFKIDKQILKTVILYFNHPYLVFISNKKGLKHILNVDVIKLLM